MKRTMRSVRTATIILVMGIALTGAVAGAADRTWTVPSTRAVSLSDVQYSDNPIIPSRQVELRTMNADFDNWGTVALYPVVHSPSGKLYYGFIRHYAGGTVSERWIIYTFPEDFRTDPTNIESEDDANYGDGLLDTQPTIPAGHYQVKWVVNNKLIDTGDNFTYPGAKGNN